MLIPRVATERVEIRAGTPSGRRSAGSAPGGQDYPSAGARGAGRVGFVELSTVRIDELWVRGGFPDSLLAASDADSVARRSAFPRTYLERDIPMLEPRVPAETLRRFWTMLAHSQGQPLNAARLGSALAVSGQTIARYVDLFVDLLLVRRIPAWFGNVGKRLVRSPKLYIRDSGVVHALLGVDTLDALLGHPVAGASWEGLVLETLIEASEGATCAYYRTAAGAELDLLVERGRERIAVEVKRSSAPRVGKGFRSACADVGATTAAVIHPGAEPFPLGGDAEAVPAVAAAAWIRDRLQRP